MDRRERILLNWHGFDVEFWIFSISFTVKAARNIYKPGWLAWLFCKLGKHSYFLDSEPFVKPTSWKCTKCGHISVLE